MKPRTQFLFAFGASAVLIGTAVVAAPVSESGRRFTVQLDGHQECSAPGVCNTGDQDGTGTATIWVNAGQERVCWEIHVSNITLPATAAHIHDAPAGQPGPVDVPLSAPDASGNSAGCVDVDREEALEIITDPATYYVNVHNSDFPAGAVRGQMSRKAN
jgi:hypothetical protein